MISVDDFDTGVQQLLAEPIALAYLSMPNCSVCLAVKPQLRQRFQGQVPIYHFDAHQLPRVAGTFQVMTAPAVLLFIDGKEVQRQARFIDIAALAKTIDAYQESQQLAPVDYQALFDQIEGQ